MLRGLLRRDPVALDEAARGLDALAMPAHAASARVRRGEFVGGAAGEQLRDAAHRSLAAAGVARPERIAAVFAPAVDSG
jgi:hypothetical protein